MMIEFDKFVQWLKWNLLEKAKMFVYLFSQWRENLLYLALPFIGLYIFQYKFIQIPGCGISFSAVVMPYLNYGRVSDLAWHTHHKTSDTSDSKSLKKHHELIKCKEDMLDHGHVKTMNKRFI